MNDFMTLVKARESCRNFDPRRVPGREDLTKCLEAARLAPSACNSQSWSFTAVTRPALVKALVPCLQGMGMNKFADSCPAFVVVGEEKPNRSAAVGAKLKDQNYGQMDIGFAAAHFCLAATDLGLATCILGWFSEEKIKAVLGINPPRIRLVLAVGYPAEETPPRSKNRKPPEEVITFLA